MEHFYMRLMTDKCQKTHVRKSTCPVYDVHCATTGNFKNIYELNAMLRKRHNVNEQSTKFQAETALHEDRLLKPHRNC